MMMLPLTKGSVLKKLETIYWHAFNDKKWHVALQVAELLGKNSGLFEKQRLPEVTRIADMTEEQLRDFIEALEKLDPELKHPPPPIPVQDP
jgi:hypothetical protein